MFSVWGRCQKNSQISCLLPFLLIILYGGCLTYDAILLLMFEYTFSGFHTSFFLLRRLLQLVYDYFKREKYKWMHLRHVSSLSLSLFCIYNIPIIYMRYVYIRTCMPQRKSFFTDERILTAHANKHTFAYTHVHKCHPFITC